MLYLKHINEVLSENCHVPLTSCFILTFGLSSVTYFLRFLVSVTCVLFSALPLIFLTSVPLLQCINSPCLALSVLDQCVVFCRDSCHAGLIFAQVFSGLLCLFFLCYCTPFAWIWLSLPVCFFVCYLLPLCDTFSLVLLIVSIQPFFVGKLSFRILVLPPLSLTPWQNLLARHTQRPSF